MNVKPLVLHIKARIVSIREAFLIHRSHGESIFLQSKHPKNGKERYTLYRTYLLDVYAKSLLLF